MADEMASPWLTLRPSQQNLVRVMAFSLQEFQYGYNRLRTLMSSETPASPIRRFYQNALHERCANYYLVRGDHKLLPYLRALGLDQHVNRVREILSRRFGSSTFGRVFRLMRDKGLVHSDYDHHGLRSDLLALVPDALTPNRILEYERLSRELLDDTAALADELFARFPEALSTMRVKWPSESRGGEWERETASDETRES